jgi:Co/Zn/Cd efflux system component
LNGKKGMGEGGLRKSNKVVNMIKIHYVHIWKCHNELPHCTIHIQ